MPSLPLQSQSYPMGNIGDFLDKVWQEGEAIFGDQSKDTTFSSQRTLPDRAGAEVAFARAVAKLFAVDGWSDLSGLTSTFALHDALGQKKAGDSPQVGDYIEIVLPGPLPENWVKVIDLRSDAERAEFTVSPSPAPGQADSPEVKHFFSKEATSTFRVSLRGNTIEAVEIGRNEGINNKGPEAGDRALVNTVVAVGGWAGVQAIQWNKLTDYLVSAE
jgi:hypothetical protein